MDRRHQRQHQVRHRVRRVGVRCEHADARSTGEREPRDVRPVLSGRTEGPGGIPVRVP
jgi:hypothetical protein